MDAMDAMGLGPFFLTKKHQKSTADFADGYQHHEKPHLLMRSFRGTANSAQWMSPGLAALAWDGR